MGTLAICQNPLCPRPNREFEPTRKNNAYCSPACRQAALRNRQKESQETLLDQRLRKLPISVGSMIKSISEDYTMEAAMQALSAVNLLLHIADAWPKEVRDLVKPDQQKMADMEVELTRYRQICDMSDRKKLENRFMALGAAFNYQRLINYNVQPGSENWLTFMQGADDATLAAALVNTETFYSNWMFFVEATDLKKAERRIAELEQTIQRYAIADQKAKEAITELQFGTNRSGNRIDSLEQELERANRTIERYESSQKAMSDAEEQRWRELRRAFMELGERQSYQPMSVAHLRPICPGLIEDIGEGKDRWEWASESFDQGALMVVLTFALSLGQSSAESKEHVLERQLEEERSAREQAERKLDQMQRRFRDYVGRTNEKVGRLCGDLAKQRQVQERSLDARRVKELEQELEVERAKYATMMDEYRQASKKIGNLERHVVRFERMGILKSRESMLQELTLLGGRLKYACLTDLGIGEGIDIWLNHIRGLSDEDLTRAIAHGYFQADSLAMAAIEASDARREMQMRKRINELEGDVRRRDDRIADLEGQQKESHLALTGELGEEEIRELEYAAREWQVTAERQMEQIAELKGEAEQLRTEIGRLKESHGSTMFTMNMLLAQAQSGQQQEGIPTSAQIADLERKIEKQQQRIGKQQMQHKERVSQLESRLAVLDAICHEYALGLFFSTNSFVPIQRDAILYRVFTADKQGHAVAKTEEQDGIQELDLTDEEMRFAQDYAYQGMLKRYEEMLRAKV